MVQIPWDKTPKLSKNTENCECGQGVPVLDRYEESMAIFRCGCCNAEYSTPVRR